ncbi:MAG: hypothetical protein V1847_04670 [Candidatus Diapherotrites archaeon]
MEHIPVKLVIDLNKQQVIEKIGKKKWKAFLKFMKGQTIQRNADGSENFYEWDVENFLKKPKDRFFD